MLSEGQGRVKPPQRITGPGFSPARPSLEVRHSIRHAGSRESFFVFTVAAKRGALRERTPKVFLVPPLSRPTRAYTPMDGGLVFPVFALIRGWPRKLLTTGVLQIINLVRFANLRSFVDFADFKDLRDLRSFLGKSPLSLFERNTIAVDVEF